MHTSGNMIVHLMMVVSYCHQKKRLQRCICILIAPISDILMHPSPPFDTLMHDWHDLIMSRDRFATDSSLPYNFFRQHHCFLDPIDVYIIETSCASRVARVLRDHHSIEDHLEQTNLAYGPGCSILGYHLLGQRLALSPGQTYLLAQQDQLHRPLSDHERAWQAMRERVFLTVQAHERFEQTHRIPDVSMKLPAVQVVSPCNAKVRKPYYPFLTLIGLEAGED
jgi:hypothetical protein